jgi:hypothetical protein
MVYGIKNWLRKLTLFCKITDNLFYRDYIYSSEFKNDKIPEANSNELLFSFEICLFKCM